MKIFAIVFVLIVATGSTSVAAQGIGRLVKDTGLVDADFNLMGDAAATLYADEPREVGSTADWQNPETGASGTVELTSFDGRCVGLRHRFKESPQARTDQFSTRRCRNDAGKWMLSLE